MNGVGSRLILQGKQTEQLINYGVTICNFRINYLKTFQKGLKPRERRKKKQVLSQSTEFADLAQPRLPKMNQYSDQVYNNYK